MNKKVHASIEELESIFTGYRNQVDTSLDEAAYHWKVIRAELEAPSCDELEEHYNRTVALLDELVEKELFIFKKLNELFL